MDIKKTDIYRNVKAVLRAYAYTRDSDPLLTYQYLRNFGPDPEKMTVAEYLKEVKNGNLPSNDTLSRIRRKIQEEDIMLRGKTRESRLARTRSVKRELGYNT